MPVRSYAQRTAAESDLDVCCSFLGHVRAGRGPSEQEQAVLASAVEAVRVQRAGVDDEGQLSLGGPSQRQGVA